MVLSSLHFWLFADRGQQKSCCRLQNAQKKKVQRHSFSDDKPDNVRASFSKTANLVYANDCEVSMPRLETIRKMGRYRDIPSGREKRPAERQRGREVMDVGKPTALHSLSLPGIVTPVSC